MKTSVLAALLLAVALAASSAVADQIYDGSKPLLCSLRSIAQCDEVFDCGRVLPGQVNLADFFEVRFGSNELVGVGGHRDGAKTPIDRTEKFDDRILLQGGDLGEDNVHGGIGWSMMIDQYDGRVVLSAITADFAFVAYGSCIER